MGEFKTSMSLGELKRRNDASRAAVKQPTPPPPPPKK